MIKQQGNFRRLDTMVPRTVLVAELDGVLAPWKGSSWNFCKVFPLGSLILFGLGSSEFFPACH